MDACLTDSQRGIRDLARDFAQQAVLPVSKQLESGDLSILKSLWQQMADAGFTGLVFPEAYGGFCPDGETASSNSIAYFLTLNEIAKVSAALATALSVHVSLGGLLIYHHGNQAQRDRYLPDLVSGKKIAAFALTEPGAGSDAGSGTCKGEKTADGYVLNGTKIFITNALLADVFIATARTQKDASGAKGLSAFIVERGQSGFAIQEGDEKMGLTGGDWGELVFDNLLVPEAQRLGEDGQGFKVFMKSLDVGRIGIASISLGLAEACLEASVQYAKERSQFGKTLSEFQAIQFKLANMATGIEAAKHLVYHAARLREAGKPFSKEASFAKLYASELCNRSASEAVQIFGGYGYTKDFPVERYFRDARVMSLFEGTSQVQHMVIAKHLLSEGS